MTDLIKEKEKFKKSAKEYVKAFLKDKTEEGIDESWNWMLDDMLEMVQDAADEELIVWARRQ